MKTLAPRILLALLLVTITALAQEQPRPPAAPGRPQRPMPKAEWLDPDHAAPNGTQYQTFASKVLGQQVSYLIWLPPEYEKEAAKRYPVIYWLHGMGANQRGGASLYAPQVAAAIQQGKLPPCIVVSVNGMVRSFYCDSTDGRVPMESVIIKDLIPHIDATYRTQATREGRVIEGYSMGGYGAAHLGFKYPELFGTVVVNAGALLDPNMPNPPREGPMFAVFGENNERRVAEFPLTLVRQNAEKLRGHTHIRVGCGSEDHLLPRNQELHDLLTQLGIEHEFEIVPGIAHDSPGYYRKLGTDVFAFHRKALSVTTPTADARKEAAH
jgi:endo-1,4-beta-xylanase